MMKISFSQNNQKIDAHFRPADFRLLGDKPQPWSTGNFSCHDSTILIFIDVGTTLYQKGSDRKGWIDLIITCGKGVLAILRWT